MYEPRVYDGIGYRVWTGLPQTFRKYPTLGHIELRVTPDNLSEIAMRADELFNQIKFDAIRLYCQTGQKFDSSIELATLAPYVKCLELENGCQKVDFSQFTCLTELLEFHIWDSKPKNLQLRSFPKLWRATLGQVSDANVLANAASLENLGLYRKLHIAKTGWKWLETLPRLQTLLIVQSELHDLRGTPECGTVKELSLGYPRGLISIDGIESFKNLTQLEIKGARQLHDYMPLASLKKLDYLGILGSGAPDSLDFLDSLPLLRRAVIGNYEYTKVDGKLIRERM